MAFAVAALLLHSHRPAVNQQCAARPASIARTAFVGRPLGIGCTRYAR